MIIYCSNKFERILIERKTKPTLTKQNKTKQNGDHKSTVFKISIQLASSLSNRIYFDATVTFLDFVDAQQQNARYLDKLTVQFQDLDPILKH